MKKLISLLLVLCLACAVVSATAEEASPVGTWYLVRGEKDGTVVQTAGMITMEFTFKEDGAAEMKTTVFGETADDTGASWTMADGILTVTDSTGVAQQMKLENGELKLDTDGTLMIFGRTPPEVPDTSIAPRLTAKSAEEFDGRWVMSRVIVMGMLATPDQIGVEDIASLEIENGVVRETAAINGEKVTQELSGEFVDGHIKVTIPTGQEVEGEALQMEYDLYMLEDGTLDGVMEIMGLEANLIYERTEAAAEEPAA